MLIHQKEVTIRGNYITESAQTWEANIDVIEGGTDNITLKI